MNIQLLCTFSNEKELDIVLKVIYEKYSYLNKIFILENTKKNKNYYCTYNVNISDSKNTIKNTISFHRNKETNTLYTINAINYIIKEMNNGILEKNIRINWENYKNSIIMISNDEFLKIETKLNKIISF